MAVKKVENKDAEQKKVKKTTTTKKTSSSKSTTVVKENKKTTSTKTTKRKKSATESAVPELKKDLSKVISNAYGLDNFKDWVENMEEVV